MFRELTDEKEYHRTSTSTMFIDISIIPKVGNHLNDQENDGSRDVILQREQLSRVFDT